MGLTATEVKNAKCKIKDGKEITTRLLDDMGLYLVVKPSGRTSWMYRYMINGKRSDMGLGPYPLIQLKEAREKHGEARRKVYHKEDPIGSDKKVRSEKRGAGKRKQFEALQATSLPTFKTIAEAYIEKHAIEWSNPKHAGQWSATMATYAYPTIGGTPIDEIDTAMILGILKAQWNDKRETMKRVRGRMEKIIAAGYFQNGIPAGNNPAIWKNHLENDLPKNGVKVKHHKSMPYKKVPAFMADLKTREAPSAIPHRFLILTAARVSDVTGMLWSEIDLEKGIWTIPPERYKTDNGHRTPLSKAALEILKSLPRTDALVFPKAPNKEFSDGAFSALQKRMNIKTTTHGFRSSFRDWSAEETDVQNHIAEMALGHVVGNAVEAAYRRGDLFQHRLELMDAWADYVSDPV